MSQKSNLHPISLQYQVRTSEQDYREIERLLPLPGELQNAVIRHRRLLGKANVPTRGILRIQNASITELRQHVHELGNPALGQTPVNRRTCMGRKPFIRALQRPLLLFTKREFGFTIF